MGGLIVYNYSIIEPDLSTVIYNASTGLWDSAG